MTTDASTSTDTARDGRAAGGVGGTPGYVGIAVADAPVRELFPGIRSRPLWTGDNGAKAQVLEMAPGSCWEGIDVHEPGPEEVFVVSGTFNDGERDHPAGSFIHAPAGSWHVPQSAAGCSLFVFYPEG
ncbi:anti-sigma factor [Streptomyces inhibens]|uniref:Anti-sigma factor n=1 Tax=Streptomyces inhibens TaxID=2293571 RepID=A0A371Q0N2_STRIH|nr:anti-sigma factor [Streptomyces inhibens]